MLMSKALATWEQVRGPDHRTTAHSLHYLGLIEWNLGRRESAQDLLSRAVTVRSRLFSDDHPDLLKTRRALEALTLGEAPPRVTPER